MKSIKEKIKSKKVVAFFILLIIALFGIVLSTGKYICPPWALQIVTQNIDSQNINDDYGILVDNGGNRLSVLDENKNVVDIKTSYKADNNLFFYGLSEITDDSFYVQEYCYFKDAHYIAQEQISKYDRNGNKIADLVTYSYNLSDNYTNTPRIKNISLSGNKLFFTHLDSLKNTYSINSIDLSSKEVVQENNIMQSFPNPCSISSVFSIVYNPSNNQLDVIDSFGNVYTASCNSSVFSQSPNNLISKYNQVGQNSAFGLLMAADESVQISPGQTIPFSILLSVRIIYFWASTVFLLVAFIVSIVIFFKGSNLKKIKARIKVPLIICFSVIISVSVIIYINNNDRKHAYENYENVLTQNVLYCKALFQNNYEDILNTNKNVEDYKLCYQQINNEFQNADLLSAKSNISSSYVLHKYDNNQWVSLVNSFTPSLTGFIDNNYSPNINNINDDGVLIEYVSNDTGNYICVSSFIYDSFNNVVGSVACYTDINTDENLINTEIIMMMVAIASALIAFSFIIMEAISWAKSFALRRRKTPKKTKNAKELSILSPLYFLNISSDAADSVIGVLVFNNMLIGTPFEGNMMVVALPLTCKTLGGFIGIILFSKIVARFGTKPTLIASAILTIICLIFCAFFVFMSQILLLSLALFLSCFFREMIWMYCNDVPVHIKDSKQRIDTNSRISASGISGAALITIVAGYASQYIGDWCVYICAAVPVVILLIILVFLLPKFCALDKNITKADKTKTNFRDVLSFIFKKDMVILFVSGFSIPVLISGYKSFIFPLIANMNGMSNADVSNLSVFANALAYYVIPLLANVQKKTGSVKLLVGVEIIISVLFMLFIINETFPWACFVYFAAQILYKFIWPSAHDYWQNFAQKTNTDSHVALTGTTIVNNVFNLLNNPVMGALMAVGPIFSCVTIGVYSFITSNIFAFHNINKK